MTTMMMMTPYDLFHGLLFAAKVQQLAKPEAGQDDHINFSRHRERQAKAQPCFIPLTTKGNDAGRITFIQRCKLLEPIVMAARR